MDNPSLPHAESWEPPFRRLFRDDKSARKKLIRKISCNPLISLDSDERIQGNPRKSNPQNLGFRSETAGIQENPNRVDDSVAPSVEKEPNRVHPNAQRSVPPLRPRHDDRQARKALIAYAKLIRARPAYS
jgi:hypothetical protein